MGMTIVAGPTTQKVTGTNTLAFDCNGGNLLVVLVGEVQATYGSFDDGTCTYDGDGMTNAISRSRDDGATYGQSVAFIIEDPSSGSNNIVRTPSDGWVTNCICAIAFANWDGIAPTTASETNDTSLSVASDADGYVLDVVTFDDVGGTTVGADQTELMNIEVDRADQKEDSRHTASRENGTGSNVTMSWSRTFLSQVAVSFSSATLFQALDGAVSFSGLMEPITMWKRVMAGALALSGAVSDFWRSLTRFFGGTLDLSGPFEWKRLLSLGSTLEFIGSFEAIAIFHRFFSGVLTLVGTLKGRLLEPFIAVIRLVLKPVSIVRTWLNPDAKVDIV